MLAYSPRERREGGVYYTPAPVVQAQVGMVADLLERCFGCRDGFSDERILVVDPATGSGAYPLAVNKHRTQHARESGAPAGARMQLLESTIGGALVARAQGLCVERRDVLAAPLALDSPIVVCLGNPPYQRGRASDRKGGFVRFGTPLLPPLLDDFKSATPGVHLKNLYNTYVYFWRWALWEVFERRTGPGVVSFITAASYLRGPGFEGVRRTLRRVLDELWIVDLEGDRLAARRSENVFPIRTPVAIATGLRYGDAQPDQAASVWYARLPGGHDEKLAALARIQTMGDLEWCVAQPGWSSALVPRLDVAYRQWPALVELFPWQVSGAQLKRTWPIAPTPEVLRERWGRLLELGPAERAAAFRTTRDRDLDSRPPDLRDPSVRLPALGQLQPLTACLEPVRFAYRSFDRQWILPDARLGDFMRPDLWRTAGPDQVFVTSLLTNVLGPGPAAVATTFVPDMDHFRGSFGGRAVVPLWRDTAGTRPNLAPGVLDQLTLDYGFNVGARQLLAYCYALLATRAYVGRFGEELREPGPRIPLTRDGELFRRVASLGDRALALHTYARVVPGPSLCLAPIGETSYPTRFDYEASSGVLRVGDGIFGPVPSTVWAYSVSGLVIVRSWLGRRVRTRVAARRSSLDHIQPSAWTHHLTRELLEVLWLVEATLNLEPALDAALDEVVSGGESGNYASGFSSQQLSSSSGRQRA